jgi:hypothetical protein
LSGDFKFGKATTICDPAKEILYPQGGQMEEKANTHAQYVKTHGNYDLGEQRNRNYNWPVEKQIHRFGYGE